MMPTQPMPVNQDRKSTRLNSSHSQISYAVFCLKKKNKRVRNLLSVSLQRIKVAHSFLIHFFGLPLDDAHDLQQGTFAIADSVILRRLHNVAFCTHVRHAARAVLSTARAISGTGDEAINANVLANDNSRRAVLMPTCKKLFNRICGSTVIILFFFFNNPTPPGISPLPLPAPLPT